jgi:Tol biopolymer transport system component
MDIDGRDQRALTGDTAQASSPAWSPDGRWIVFLSDQTGDWAAHITAVDGSGTCLLAGPQLQASNPVWSPDGGWVYFIDNTTDALMAIFPDSQDQQVVFQDASITMLYSPVWLPGGH